MDFQKLFKRKEEEPPPSLARPKTRETLNERDVLVCEGELWDGETPASLVWSSVGGRIKVKADKITGILEGRARVKAAILHELFPGLFEKEPNPGTEFTIPLQRVVMQLEDIFTDLSLEDSVLEDFQTPFGQLAREDEAKFNDSQTGQPASRPCSTPKLFTLPGAEATLTLNGLQDQRGGLEDLTKKLPVPETERENLSGGGSPSFDDPRFHAENFSLPESSPVPNGFAVLSDASKPQIDQKRREGHECLQELYLTDESLDGSKVADLILRLPRVVGVVIMLSDGAVLGGGLSGGLNEALLSLAPGFVKHLLGFTKSVEGGPANCVTFWAAARQISLTIDGAVCILTGHEGKNLPPGLRVRLGATAHALNMIYGSQS